MWGSVSRRGSAFGRAAMGAKRVATLKKQTIGRRDAKAQRFGIDNCLLSLRLCVSAPLRAIVHSRPLKPAEIRGIGMALNVSQALFAPFLKVSLMSIESWEAGATAGPYSPQAAHHRQETRPNRAFRLRENRTGPSRPYGRATHNISCQWGETIMPHRCSPKGNDIISRG